MSQQPADRLVSGQQIAASDVAAYFHTGGTTGTPKLVRQTHENQVYQAWACDLMFESSLGRNALFGMPVLLVPGGAGPGFLATFFSQIW